VSFMIFTASVRIIFDQPSYISKPRHVCTYVAKHAAVSTEADAASVRKIYTTRITAAEGHHHKLAAIFINNINNQKTN
jgi:hypothetical protein